MKVLIIDDVPEDLREMKMLISSRKDPNGKPYDVLAITNHEEALKIIDTEPFDIVITDMLMGKMQREEGIKVLQQLANKSSVAIVITGHPSIPNCVQSMKAGAWDYIEKQPMDGKDPYERLLGSIYKACEYRTKNPARGVVDPDSEWVHNHLNELMEKYAGQLVAVLYEKVVDSDINFAELSERVASKYPLAKPTIVSIPDFRSEHL